MELSGVLSDGVETDPQGTRPTWTVSPLLFHVTYYTYVVSKKLLTPKDHCETEVGNDAWEVNCTEWLSFTQKSVFIFSRRHLRLRPLSTNEVFPVCLWHFSEELGLISGLGWEGSMNTQDASVQWLRWLRTACCHPHPWNLRSVGPLIRCPSSNVWIHNLPSAGLGLLVAPQMVCLRPSGPDSCDSSSVFYVASDLGTELHNVTVIVTIWLLGHTSL